MTTSPTTPVPSEELRKKLEVFSSQGAHACYCPRSTDGGCTCALKDEYVTELLSMFAVALAKQDTQSRLSELTRLSNIAVAIGDTRNWVRAIPLETIEARRAELRKLQQPAELEAERKNV